jgi:hypothetical protein
MGITAPRRTTPRFASEAERRLAKESAAIAAFNAASQQRGARHAATASKQPTTPPSSPPPRPPTGPGKRAGGAGVDYPASWNTSPIDTADESDERSGRLAATAADHRGAGVDYPAHWRR